MSKLPPRSLVSRTLALLILLGALFSGYWLILAPIVAVYDTTAQSVERSRMLLGRYRALAAQREELTDRMAARVSAGENAAYFNAPTGALAAVAVQDHVRSMIVQAGGQLHSTQVLKNEPLDAITGVSRSRLKLNLDMDIEGLEYLLYNLESSEPYLFIEQIRLQVQTGHGGHEQRRLAVSLEIYGYALMAEARDESGAVDVL